MSGAGSGIGRATAWLAARLGARVVICGRSMEKLSAVRAALTARGLRCEAFPLDIRDRAAVEQVFDDVFARCGALDLLVNSAGGQFPQAAIDFSDKGWRAVIDTNLTGTFNMMQSAARHWRTLSAPGSIVSLVVSPRGLHQVAHTLAARAGVVAFSEAVAVEWAPLSIRVNCVAPGAIVSEGWAAYPQEIHRRYRQASPLRLRRLALADRRGRAVRRRPRRCVHHRSDTARERRHEPLGRDLDGRQTRLVCRGVAGMAGAVSLGGTQP